MKKSGRPSKLSKETTEKLCSGIAAGLGYVEACKKAGISRTTFFNWRRRGEGATAGQYLHFLTKIREAEAIALLNLEDALTQSALGGQVITEKKTVTRGGIIVEEAITEKVTLPDGRLALMILERRKREVWGKRDKVDITSGNEPLKVQLFGNCGFGTGNDLDLGTDSLVEVMEDDQGN